MSEALLSLILTICPGNEVDSKGQVITTECQEQLINCVINKAGKDGPEKFINECASQLGRKGS